MSWASVMSAFVFTQLNPDNTAASTTFFLWDYLLTLGDELQVIWRGEKWSLSRACFLVVRYLTMACLAYVIFRECCLQPVVL